MAGPNSVIQYQIQAPGDLYAGAPKGDPAAALCGVPPPPFESKSLGATSPGRPTLVGLTFVFLNLH